MNSPWEDDSDLVNRVSLTPVNKQVQVTVYRNGQEVTLNVRVGDRKRFE